MSQSGEFVVVLGEFRGFVLCVGYRGILLCRGIHLFPFFHPFSDFLLWYY